MAYHGFVQHGNKYAILMDKEDVEALIHILGAHSAKYAAGIPVSNEFSVLAGMFSACEELGVPAPTRSAHMRLRVGRSSGELVGNWYYEKEDSGVP